MLATGEDWVVVGKPSGLLVHRNAESRDDTYVVQVARDQLGRHVWPVHRLDRPTSGCLLLAFSPEAVARLQPALTAGKKQYLAFVRGRIAHRDPVDVTNPMKDSHGVVREAHTALRCLASGGEPPSSLVLASPTTGRFHQVRRHIRDLSHPVLGDGTHGDSRVNRWWREERGLQRLGLHCLTLSVALDGEPGIEALCPVPDDLLGLWRTLAWWPEAVAALPLLGDTQ